MKKVICLVCLVFILIGTSGCSLTTLRNMIIVDREKIGAEYMVIENWQLNPNDSHGSVKNYSSNFSDNVWTTKFDSMNSTGCMSLEIDPDDTLKINSKVDSGDVWVKITQGDLVKSRIQKIQAVNGENITVDLSQWKPGEIHIWLVVRNGKNGLIQIEHVKKEANQNN